MTLETAEVVAEQLTQEEETLATAESATAGLVSTSLVDIAGASDWFDRGYVTYSYSAKEEELDVEPDALQREGAVSTEVVEQMAAGAVEAAGVDWAVATSGIAGPTGGSSEKPVGTIYLAVARSGDYGFVRSQRREFDGTRSELKQRFAEAALELLATEVVGDR